MSFRRSGCSSRMATSRGVRFAPNQLLLSLSPGQTVLPRVAIR